MRTCTEKRGGRDCLLTLVFRHHFSPFLERSSQGIPVLPSTSSGIIPRATMDIDADVRTMRCSTRDEAAREMKQDLSRTLLVPMDKGTARLNQPAALQGPPPPSTTEPPAGIYVAKSTPLIRAEATCTSTPGHLLGTCSLLRSESQLDRSSLLRHRRCRFRRRRCRCRERRGWSSAVY